MAKKKTVKDAVITEKEKKEKEEVVEKVEKEEVEETTKKEKKNKKVKEPKEKKNGFFKGIRKEMKQVVWPTAGDVAKSTLAVLFMCIFLCLFFAAVSLFAAFLKGLFV